MGKMRVRTLLWIRRFLGWLGLGSAWQRRSLSPGGTDSWHTAPRCSGRRPTPARVLPPLLNRRAATFVALYPLRAQGRLGMAPSVGAQRCFWNEPLGALRPSPCPEPFFRLTVKNEERGQEGVSCLSKVYVTLPETTITLLKGRHTLVSPFSTQPCRAAGLGCGLVPPISSRAFHVEQKRSLAWRWGSGSPLGVLLDPRIYLSVSSLGPAFQVGGQRVTLPAIPSKGIFLTPSGRSVQLQTAFGLRVRWDGDQQLSVSVPR